MGVSAVKPSLQMTGDAEQRWYHSQLLGNPITGSPVS